VGSGLLNLGFEILDCKSDIRDLGYTMWDQGSDCWDLGYVIWHRSRIWDLGLRVWDPVFDLRFRMWVMETGISDLETGVLDLTSVNSNLRSGTWDLGTML
jgi:hypothetical protein